MKKIFVVILSAFFCCINLFSGCQLFQGESEDEFVLVRALRFTTAGKEKGVSSSIIPDYEEIGKATQAEYDDFKNNNLLHIYGPAWYYGQTLESVTTDRYYYLTKDDIGETVLIRSKDLPGAGTVIDGEEGSIMSCYTAVKVVFKGWHYQYLYVKVIDDETIAYHFGDKNKVFNYKVTYYRITYFEN